MFIDNVNFLLVMDLDDFLYLKQKLASTTPVLLHVHIALSFMPLETLQMLARN